MVVAEAASVAAGAAAHSVEVAQAHDGKEVEFKIQNSKLGLMRR